MRDTPDDGDVARRTGWSPSRRAFLGLGPLLGGGAAVAACAGADEPPPIRGGVDAPQHKPLPPDQQPPVGVLEFLSAEEARAVDAMTARILPGDADDPGAREAAVTTYIDAKLASFEAFAEPTFLQAPFAAGYTGLVPAVADAVPVPEDQLFRYGYQSGQTPQQLYRTGLVGLDRYSVQRYQAPFADLPDDQQDAVLEVLDAVSRRDEQERSQEGGPQGGGTGSSGGPPDADLDAAEDAFGDTGPGSFFTTVRTDAIEGMFADPVYGGNRGLVGWTMIGYPGPQRSYSPDEMRNGTRRSAQSLDGLPAMSPDRHSPHAPEALEKPRRGVTGG